MTLIHYGLYLLLVVFFCYLSKENIRPLHLEISIPDNLAVPAEQYTKLAF